VGTVAARQSEDGQAGQEYDLQDFHGSSLGQWPMQKAYKLPEKRVSAARHLVVNLLSEK
jgi:hypothetical protein